MAVRFRKPTQADIVFAIGDVKALPPHLQQALRPDAVFEPISIPRPGDWLAEHHEPGQTFEAYTASWPYCPSKRRNVIYLQPLGPFLKDQSPDLNLLQAFAKAFFMLEVHPLPAMEIDNLQVTSRINQLPRVPTQTPTRYRVRCIGTLPQIVAFLPASGLGERGRVALQPVSKLLNIYAWWLHHLRSLMVPLRATGTTDVTFRIRELGYGKYRPRPYWK